MSPREEKEHHENLVAKITDGLAQFSDAGVIEYYLSSIPEGEVFVVGVAGEIYRMSPTEAMCFVIGASAMATAVSKKLGLSLP